MSRWGLNRNDSGADNGEEDLHLIPAWSIVLAIVLFAGAQYIFHSGPPHTPHAGQNLTVHHDFVAMRILMGYVWGTLLASYALMLGYISRDARRRGMSAPLWMVVCLVLVGGIGAVVYFLLRQPVLKRCPNCSTEMASTFHFCPQCQFQMAPVCGECHDSVRITDAYCTRCGHELAADNAPARLRVYSD